MKNEQISKEELSIRVKKDNLKFVGFISEDDIKDLKPKGFVFCIMKESNGDLLNQVLTGKKQNVYVYKKGVEQLKKQER